MSVSELLDGRAESTFYSDAAATTTLALPLAVAVGDTETIYYRSEITPQDAVDGNVNNSITVNGTATVGGQEIAVTDSDDTPLCPFTPDTGIEVVKSCPTVTEETRVGDAVIYPITITNTGEVPVTISSAPTDIRPGGTFHSDAAGAVDLAYPIVLDPAGGAGRLGDDLLQEHRDRAGRDRR